MKQLIIALFTTGLLASTSGFADDRRILVDQPMEHGGFGGMVLGWTMLGDSPNYLFGIKGAWLVSHSYYIGGSGIVGLKPVGTDTTYNASGLILGYKHAAMNVSHVATELFIGTGGIVNKNNTVADSFIVVEPSIQWEINLDRFTTVGTALSYRHTQDASVALDGVAVTLNLSAGVF